MLVNADIIRLADFKQTRFLMGLKESTVRIYPEWSLNVCTKFQGDPSSSCWDIEILWNKVTDWQTDPAVPKKKKEKINLRAVVPELSDTHKYWRQTHLSVCEGGSLSAAA